jgi:hypothetical protein
MGETAVYLEIGGKRAIASALDWPGWCRSGRSEADALAALLAYAARYAAIARLAGLPFDAPAALSDLTVAGRIQGNASTDYGVPDRFAPGDEQPMDAAAVARAAAILRGCWAAFDGAAEAAAGKELAKGPRGGGRTLEGVARHVIEAESAYAQRVGVALAGSDANTLPDWRAAAAVSRDRVLTALVEAGPLGMPAPGPRGGKRWPARYFVRRVAYHVVDHAWEIEDRAQGA